jgi:hypothetical protein
MSLLYFTTWRWWQHANTGSIHLCNEKQQDMQAKIRGILLAYKTRIQTKRAPTWQKCDAWGEAPGEGDSSSTLPTNIHVNGATYHGLRKHWLIIQPSNGKVIVKWYCFDISYSRLFPAVILVVTSLSRGNQREKKIQLRAVRKQSAFRWNAWPHTRA